MRVETSRVIARTLLLLVLLAAASTAPAQNLGFERGRAKNMLGLVSDHIKKNFYDPNLRGLNWDQLTTQARHQIESARDVGEMYAAIFGLVEQLQDSHTVFLPPSRADRHNFGFEARPYGDEIRIYEITKTGAAEAGGLRRGDRILGVNGIRAERDSFDFVMLYFRILRPVMVMDVLYSRSGQLPTTVRLEPQIKREPLLTDFTKIDNIYKLIREAQSARKEAEARLYDGDVGYIRLPYFFFSGGKLASLIEKVQNTRAVVIDLRDNGGGSTDVLADLVGHFEPEPISIADFVERKKTEPAKVRPRKPNLSQPLFILVDSASASASEMFARHFQLARRAVIIGDRTAGRVNASHFFSDRVGVDVVVPFGVQISVARVVLPNGEELEKRGVIPDRPCVPTPEDLLKDRDPCLDLALSLARRTSEPTAAAPKPGN